MRLKISATSANEQLLGQVTQVLKLHAKLWSDYKQAKDDRSFKEDALQEHHRKEINLFGSAAGAIGQQDVTRKLVNKRSSLV